MERLRLHDRGFYQNENTLVDTEFNHRFTINHESNRFFLKSTHGFLREDRLFHVFFFFFFKF